MTAVRVSVAVVDALVEGPFAAAAGASAEAEWAALVEVLDGDCFGPAGVAVDLPDSPAAHGVVSKALRAARARE